MPTVSRPVQLPSGSWRIRWLDGAGKRKSAVFATHNDARAALARAQADSRDVRQGTKPAPPPKRTFADLTESWMATRALHKRSIDADVSRLRAHLTPVFGKLALQDITHARVEAFKAERAGLSQQTLRHLLTLLGSMLKHAHRLGWLPMVPPIDKPSVWACRFFIEPAVVRPTDAADDMCWPRAAGRGFYPARLPWLLPGASTDLHIASATTSVLAHAVSCPAAPRKPRSTAEHALDTRPGNLYISV